MVVDTLSHSFIKGGSVRNLNVTEILSRSRPPGSIRYGCLGFMDVCKEVWLSEASKIKSLHYHSDTDLRMWNLSVTVSNLWSNLSLIVTLNASVSQRGSGSKEGIFLPFIITGGVSWLYSQNYPTTYKLRYGSRQALIMDIKYKHYSHRLHVFNTLLFTLKFRFKTSLNNTTLFMDYVPRWHNP